MGMREANITALRENHHDVLVVGGGINGAVSAAALAHHGARVALVDAGDFAGETSQHSSNLAWGGIKYLESLELGLVWDLCKSRNELIRSFPSTVQEIRFLATIPKGFRRHPRLVWLGAWLYWLLGRGFTMSPSYLSHSRIKAQEPIIDVTGQTAAVEYSDAYLHDNDARFVFNFIRSAQEAGCVVTNYVRSLVPRRSDDGGWMVRVRDEIGLEEFPVRARILVNATGPFVDEHNRLSGVKTNYRHVLSKGVHLIVERLTESRRVLAFFAEDGRLFFAIPMYQRTCIGTTDTPADDPHAPVTDADRHFVLDNINRNLDLARPLTTSDIIAERCGVRPLAVEGGAHPRHDFLQLSRKHVVEVSAAQRHVSIFGGKLTDCLNVGEEICNAARRLGVPLAAPGGGRWYGEPAEAERSGYFRRARALGLDALPFPGAQETTASRLWRRYGSHAVDLLDAIASDPRQSDILIEGTEYLRCEIHHIAAHELVVKLDDFLRRRSKIAQVTRGEALRAAPGLREACEILFGPLAQTRYEEYFQP
jgi:glycerol-3-phosphate dehydrogenase